jgi:hypothetical protein
MRDKVRSGEPGKSSSMSVSTTLREWPSPDRHLGSPGPGSASRGAPLPGVEDADPAAIVLAHDAAQLPAGLLIALDQLAAEIGLEDAGNDGDGRRPEALGPDVRGGWTAMTRDNVTACCPGVPRRSGRRRRGVAGATQGITTDSPDSTTFWIGSNNR